MPAGVSWPKYILHMTVALLTGLAGAQTVHVIYQPLADLDELILKELDKLKKEKGLT